MNTRNIVTTAVGIAALAAGTIGGSAAGFGLGWNAAPTPNECLIALDEADRTLDLTAEALGLAGEAVYAAAIWDANTLDQIATDLEDVTTELGEPDTYLDAKAACKGETR